MKSETFAVPRSVRGSDSFFAFLRAGFWLEQNDFKILSAVSVGIFLLTMAVMTLIQLFVKYEDTAPLAFGVAGALMFFYAVIGGLLESLSVFTLTYSNGVRMSEPRRRMVALGWSLSLANSALLLALAFLLDKVWYYGFGLRFAGTEAFIGYIPWWGWLFAALIPTALGCLAGGILAWFGRRGGIVLYALFMACYLSPSLLSSYFESLPGNTLDAFLAALPWLGLALTVVATAAGTAMLLHASVGTEG